MTSRERLQPMLISFNFSKQKIKKLSTLFSLSNLLNKHPKRICKSLLITNLPAIQTIQFLQQF